MSGDRYNPPHGQGLAATYQERALDHLADAHPGPSATAYAVLALADQVEALVVEARRIRRLIELGGDP